MAHEMTFGWVLTEGGPPASQAIDAMRVLQPSSVRVDLAAPEGRHLLAALQTAGLPAHVLEKRERPSLPEIQAAERLSKEVASLKEQLEEQERELIHLRAYQRDVRVLIQWLE